MTFLKSPIESVLMRQKKNRNVSIVAYILRPESEVWFIVNIILFKMHMNLEFTC